MAYRQVAKIRPRNILELGLGDGKRTANLLAVARQYHEASEIRYTGVDLFEGRAKSMATLKLKDAYCAFRPTGVDVRLIPGNAGIGLRMLAGGGRKYDLVLADASAAEQLDQGAMEIIHRLTSEHSVLIVPGCNGLTAKVLRQTEILSHSPRPDSSKAA